MAILCGLAIELHRHRPETVILLFQPAEEDGSGAQKCFQTQNLLHFPDYVLPYIIYLDQKSDYS
jgi:metal-dependent amidase/aminoacylase/carboxypeptidase family protein